MSLKNKPTESQDVSGGIDSSKYCQNRAMKGNNFGVCFINSVMHAENFIQ